MSGFKFSWLLYRRKTWNCVGLKLYDCQWYKMQLTCFFCEVKWPEVNVDQENIFLGGDLRYTTILKTKGLVGDTTECDSGICWRVPTWADIRHGSERTGDGNPIILFRIDFMCVTLIYRCLSCPLLCSQYSERVAGSGRLALDTDGGAI